MKQKEKRRKIKQKEIIERKRRDRKRGTQNRKSQKTESQEIAKMREKIEMDNYSHLLRLDGHSRLPVASSAFLADEVRILENNIYTMKVNVSK